MGEETGEEAVVSPRMMLGRVALTEEQFRALVLGEIIRLELERGWIDVALSDIGFGKMAGAVAEAMERAFEKFGRGEP
jgi:hypothetical protein